MATVKLSEYECRKDLLPKVCMFCGERAVTRKSRNFAWHPPWVWLLVLVALIVAAIVALILTKRMTVRVPVCDRHKGFWLRKGLITGLSFAFLCVLAVGLFVFMANQGPGNDEITGWFCLGWVGLFLVWLVGAAIYSALGVRPTEITGDYIRLTGVDEEFVAALEEDRDRDYEEEEERRRKRRAKRLEEERERDRESPRRIERRRDDDDLERRSRD